MIRKIKNCPLCGSSNFIFFSNLKKNLYSEIISKIIDLNENYLIKKIKNYKCKICGIIFKNYWFDDKILEKIYNNFIIHHPRGQDFKSNLFSRRGLSTAFSNLLIAKKKGDIENENRYSRTIKSIIFSIPNYKKLKSTSWISSKSRSFDSNLNINLLKKNINKIKNLINEPVEFKRFSGFESRHLWKYFNQKIKIKSYAEVGCPQWGLFGLEKKTKLKKYFIKRNEKNFWGKKCKINNSKNCILYKKEKTNFKIINYESLSKLNIQLDLVSSFQYIDHLREPFKFFKNLNEISGSQAYIVDNYKSFDNTIYIQHFTGWSLKPFSWVSKKLKKKLHNNFTRIKNTEHDLFLLT